MLEATINDSPQPFKKGLLNSGGCIEAVKTKPSQDERWNCSMAGKDKYCMSAITGKDVHPDIVYFKCIEGFKHYMCEACFLYY
jgi:hypothetical protein